MKSLIQRRGHLSVGLFILGLTALAVCLTLLALGLTGQAEWWMGSPFTPYLSLLPLIIIALAVVTDRARRQR
ncbi:hypothetical protein ABMA10_04205 [Plantibacter sp. RU18]